MPRTFLHSRDENRQPPTSLDRRSLLKLMGASLSLAGIVGCTGIQDEEALPYVTQPDGITPGLAKWYATAVTFCGYAQPVLGKTYTGRPVKLEGNPEHPASQGKSDAFTQAALLGLYDPHRSRGPRRLGEPVAWNSFLRWATNNAAEMDRRKGEGFRLLTGPFSSPTLARQIRALMRRWPQARWHRLEGGLPLTELEAARSLFGQPYARQTDLAKTDILVGFDDDFLGPGPHQTLNGVQFGQARSRGHNGDGKRLRLFTADVVPSATGAIADHRVMTTPNDIAPLVQSLGAGLGVEGIAPPGRMFTPETEAWLARAAKALAAARGRSLVTVGATQPVALLKLGLLINDHLGNTGKTLTFIPPVLETPPDDAGMAALVADMAAGKVETLLCLDANPVYQATADLGFGAALEKVPLRIHAGLHYDETAALSHWHLPLQHDLESWSDARAVDGTASIVQPLVRPFFDVRSRHEILDLIAGGDGANGRALVQQTWREAWDDRFDERWRDALFKGSIAGSRPASATPDIRDRAVTLPERRPESSGLTALIRPDAGVWDGAFSENAWLQETPRPLSKIVWDNVIQIAPQLADQHQLHNGDLVELSDGEAALRGPVFIVAGQDARTVVLTLGYGRAIDGGLSSGIGYDAARLRRRDSLWRRDDLLLTPLGKTLTLASTQPHQNMAGYDFVRSVAASGETAQPQPAQEKPDFYPALPAHDPSWGMSIDLDLCIGCNACVTACQAENNIPVVGKEMVAQGREMHWMRIDHYADMQADGPQEAFQPVPCMHCEQAPCEMGCPVNAAVHSIDGLNLQVYNRCIGTRTCSSFCPYKVRHFNWFDFTADDPDSIKAMRNPQVTVRSRGVMEKCTYCVQRIEEARITADKENRAIADGEVVTACQQACPSRAIVFGNIADPASQISRSKADARNYTLLEEANTRPRTTYMARIRPETDDGEGGEG